MATIVHYIISSYDGQELSMMIFEIFQYGFMQRALISGIAVAISCSVIGLFLVLRRQSLFGDALSHVAFGGIVIGLFTNIYPIWTAFIVSVCGVGNY